jgi:hypothetical protein
MNLKRPPVFLRIPSKGQEIHSIKSENIVCLVDRLTPEIETEVHHIMGDRSKFFITTLTSQEIEEGMSSLIEQQDNYNDQYFNTMFSGDDE